MIGRLDSFGPGQAAASAKRRLDTLGYGFQKFQGGLVGITAMAPISLEELQDRIRKSQERELGFSFVFDFRVYGGCLCELARRLRREGLYYWIQASSQ